MQSINFGQTISRASSLIGATLGSVGVFVVISQLAFGVLNALLRTQLVAVIETDPLAMFTSLWYWATILSSVIGGALVYAGATAGMVMADRGEAVSVGDCFARGLAKTLPAIGLIILWILGIYVGFILLVVPGCILLAMWSVCFPALIAEDVGVIGAFGRSRALTKGSRLKIFLLLLLLLVMIYGGLIVLLAGVGFQFGSVAMATSTSLGLQIVLAVSGVVFGLIINALLVAIYGELTDRTGDRMSDVFN